MELGGARDADMGFVPSMLIFQVPVVFQLSPLPLAFMLPSLELSPSAHAISDRE
ncbi:hypothetical protein ACFOZ8_13300 [Paenibacillus xanthanilyticus]|uniref:Uncharacterized protein n=1 Tax=Paenibacillus xanthanilyticus TaxID=1783531 RepID=A0ABV8K3N6_9BACL